MEMIIVERGFNMVSNMKSVMVFDAIDSDVETANKWINWLRYNKSAVADKNVPGAEETRKMLHAK